MTMQTGTMTNHSEAALAADEHIVWCRSEEFHPFEVLIALGSSLKVGELATWEIVRNVLIERYGETANWNK